MTRTLVSALVLFVAFGLGGCRGAGGRTTFDIPSGRYERAFDATRDVLADARFRLERVDARRGVITTQAKGTVGLLTPWDGEQSSFVHEWEDVTNQQERVVRVTFTPAADQPIPGPDEAPADYRSGAGSMVANVEVHVLRVRWPGWRPETESIRRSTRSLDPLQHSRGVRPGMRTELRDDPAFAARLAERIRRKLGAAFADDDRVVGSPDEG